VKKITSESLVGGSGEAMTKKKKKKKKRKKKKKKRKNLKLVRGVGVVLHGRKIFSGKGSTMGVRISHDLVTEHEARKAHKWCGSLDPTIRLDG